MCQDVTHARARLSVMLCTWLSMASLLLTRYLQAASCRDQAAVPLHEGRHGCVWSQASLTPLMLLRHAHSLPQGQAAAADSALKTDQELTSGPASLADDTSDP